MAGYMKKLQGYVYNGEFLSGEALANGIMAGLVTANGKTTVKKITADDTGLYRVVEKTTLFGKNAVILEMIKIGDAENFFVENEWDINDACDYNTAEYTLPVGKYVRMHRVLPGEQLITTDVADAAFTALAVGDNAVFGATGVKKKTA